MSFLNRNVSETQIRFKDRLWLYIFSIIVLFLLIVPSLVVIPMSFSGSQYLEFPPKSFSLRWYEAYFFSSADTGLGFNDWMGATWTSIKVAVLTIFVATPIGTMAAYGLSNSSAKVRGILFPIMISPMMVPIILVAIGLFYFFVQFKMVNSITGLVLGHSLVAMPLVLIIVLSALRNYDMNQEKVARSLGASRLRAFFEITLPQIKFSIISACLISFLTSFDEVIISLFVSGGDNSTITRAMFLALRDQIDPTIAAISTVLIVISSGLLLLTQLFGDKKD
ncbi:MAG: ABC transporter permease [Rhodobacteraceae bacterium]|jgi:putative spermidine/putrescine transport system permease protein|nr:ABC transporter permease [Paracoccaceae bacterium]MBT4285320.1 ABC transporter permease [Paracoccaceae bacterium]MBT6272253.1 ABC transporter permease [Paracoccaceae bacterium]MBT6436746.1 ABC transporter permease [Paracoccaceae bacterium]MDG2373237.1 ABC transporter permease [Paracoccaceae bacterium]|tara:strand:- start:1936 stop:2775 length:840 start_codon:yes stop_codon:yes gene_type:complete